MSHHSGLQPQSSQNYQLVNLSQGSQPSSHLPNASQESYASRSPLSQVHPNSPPNPESPPPETKQEEWVSWKLHWWWMLLILSFNIGLLVSIIYLQRLSSTNNGIATVKPDTAPFISVPNVFSKPSHYSVHYGFLWTTIPSLVMTAFSLMWMTIVSATASRQPFVELNSQGETKSAKTTIMLDYRTYSAFNNYWKAFRRHHIGLGIAMILSSFLSFAMGPIIASLLVSAASQSHSPVSVNHTQTFNDSRFDHNANLQPSLDFASSIRTYNAQPPSWMTETYAFAAFEPLTSSTARSSNLTANTTAYSAELDCQAYSATESNAFYSVDSLGDAAVSYSMVDRGCNISFYQSVINTTSTYSESWNWESCPGTPYGRIGIFGGIYSDSSPTKIANYTLVSCIPRYFSVSGLLTIALDSGETPNFISFNQTASVEIQPFWTGTIEHYLHNYNIFDPSNSFAADAFGFAVLQNALVLNPYEPLTGASFSASMADLYSTLVVHLTYFELLQDAGNLGEGEVSSPVQRLYVVDGVAWTVVAVLVAALACNVYLWVYAVKRKSILVEEPKGVLGYAGLVVGSGVQEVVEGFRMEHPGEGKVRKSIKDGYTVEHSRCWYDKNEGRIRVTGLVDKCVSGS